MCMPNYLVKKSAYCVMIIYFVFDDIILNKFVTVGSINIGINLLLLYHCIPYNFSYLITERAAIFAYP